MSHKNLEAFLNLDEFHAYCNEKGVTHTGNPVVGRRFPAETAFALMVDAFMVMQKAYPHNYSDQEVEMMAARTKNDLTEVTPENIQHHLMSKEGSMRFIELLFHFIGMRVEHAPESWFDAELSTDTEDKIKRANQLLDDMVLSLKNEVGISSLGVAAMMTNTSMRHAFDNHVDIFKLLELMSFNFHWMVKEA